MDLLRPGRKRYVVGVLVAVTLAMGTMSTSLASSSRGRRDSGGKFFESFRRRIQLVANGTGPPAGTSADAGTDAPPLLPRAPPRISSDGGAVSKLPLDEVVLMDASLPTDNETDRGSDDPEPPVSEGDPVPPIVPVDAPVSAAPPEPASAAPAAPVADADASLDLSDTAVVTMAAGDESARLAIALVQSLRDTQTRIPHIVVMLARGGSGSADCQNGTWKAAVGREDRKCQAPDAIAQEIVSGVFLATLARLGAEVIIVDSIEETEWTKKVPGGRQVVRNCDWARGRAGE